MTGTNLGKLFGVFLITPLLAVAVIFALLGVLFPAIGTFCYAVAFIGVCFAAYLWGSIRFVEAKMRQREARDRALFASDKPQLHDALVAVESICNGQPGLKRIRFSSILSGDDEEDIVVYAFADVWSGSGKTYQPISIGGMPVEEWKQAFAAAINNYSLGFRFVASPISLCWPGGLGAGCWK